MIEGYVIVITIGVMLFGVLVWLMGWCGLGLDSEGDDNE